MDVRKNGNWEGWIKFFLTGVAAVSHEAADTAKRVVHFRTHAQGEALQQGKQEFALINHMFRHPIIDARTAERLLGVSFASANAALGKLQKTGFIRETTGNKRNRIFRFESYLKLFDDAPEPGTPIYDPEAAGRYVHGAEGTSEKR
jgi:Fic family protein